MELTEKFEIDNCKNKISYNIIHDDIPLKMSPDLIDAIKYLLWYVPDIASIQSRENELVSNILYDDFTFLEIMKYMKLRDEDVWFAEEIPKEIEKVYLHSVCTNSQKIVMTKGENETKTSAVLRHIRNAIAHGYFNIVEDLIVGFDYKPVTKHEEKCTAFFKINPTNLLMALKSLDNELTSKQLVTLALKNNGYHVAKYEENFETSERFDLYARKGSNQYAIELHPYNSQEKIHHQDVLNMIERFEGMFRDLKTVLVINSSFLLEESKDELLQHEVIILDVKNIKKMLAGRDMLSGIVRDNKFK
ncbi:hypothetical protein SAMN00017477_1195 [Peptoniphilus asaccharolyticus DSM 20463]|uniref:Restriction endonuclease n=1 Tax=Peptoniphilus asaccharolyticus DSM 20463 TaxID=573058 RepID=A0A1W1V2R5_PEPAS|nr:hypothetical protein [Peptoniphilus asaccharolyticus]MBL7576143.1 hypothetical protein [Peptoniphilus asaccharolyticus]SMB87580.1 hypothetical protein SAMN00017477_1195 [Peptoniphilus asaccharolyticus DSM 20463]